MLFYTPSPPILVQSGRNIETAYSVSAKFLRGFKSKCFLHWARHVHLGVLTVQLSTFIRSSPDGVSAHCSVVDLFENKMAAVHQSDRCVSWLFETNSVFRTQRNYRTCLMKRLHLIRRRETDRWVWVWGRVVEGPAAGIVHTKARRALATLVAQLFSCPDGEHCCIRERAHWQHFCCGNRKVAAWCGLTHSRGNRTVADKDRTHVFQSVRAHWQLKSCLVAAVRCTNRVSWVIQLCLS